MSAGEEFEKDGRIDGKIAPNADRPQGCKTSDGGEIWRARRDQSKNGGDADGEIEGPASSEDIAAEPPEHRSKQQADILSQRQ